MRIQEVLYNQSFTQIPQTNINHKKHTYRKKIKYSRHNYSPFTELSFEDLLFFFTLSEPAPWKRGFKTKR